MWFDNIFKNWIPYFIHVNLPPTPFYILWIHFILYGQSNSISLLDSISIYEKCLNKSQEIPNGSELPKNWWIKEKRKHIKFVFVHTMLADPKNLSCGAKIDRSRFLKNSVKLLAGHATCKLEFDVTSMNTHCSVLWSNKRFSFTRR